MAATYISGPVIEAGQSLSSALDVSKQATGGLQRITMPAQWDAGAWLTFQFSLDNANFHDLYWPDGAPVVVTVRRDSTVFLRHDIWRFGYFKFRSGSWDNPIIQTQPRIFQCALY